MGTSRRQKRLAIKAEFKKPVSEFEQIDLLTEVQVPPGMTRAYRNSRFTVMVFDNQPVSTGTATLAMIYRHNNAPIPNHWSEIQKIKNELFGEETTAVEYYPAKSLLIDEHNIYWIWIYPDSVLPMPILTNQNKLQHDKSGTP